MFPFFFPFRRRNYHMHFGCLGGLLRLVLVALGIKYVLDKTRDQPSTQLWPPQGQSRQPPYTPGQTVYSPPQTAEQPRPAPGRETARLPGGDTDPWVDKVE